MIDSQVLIVTLCKSLNAGAYLQAFALQEVLKQKNMHPVFLDVYDFRQSVKRFHVMRKRRDRNLRGLLFNARKFAAFRRAEKRLNIVSTSTSQRFSAAFLGSDEIWSTRNGSFISVPEFFGLKLNAEKRFSYAPSAGNTTLEDVLANPSIKDGLQQLDLVSVRDSQTKAIAERFVTDSDVSLVLDPTFLYDFAGVEEPVTLRQPYIAVYSYGLDSGKIAEIREFAARRGCQTVSVSFNNDWCDVVMPSGPFEFLSVIRNADYVVTDTFHGSIFSIKYRRNLLCYAAQKNKVLELLKDLQLEECIIDEGDLQSRGSAQTDYSGTGELLQEKVRSSHDFLDRCIKQIETSGSSGAASGGDC